MGISEKKVTFAQATVYRYGLRRDSHLTNLASTFTQTTLFVTSLLTKNARSTSKKFCFKPTSSQAQRINKSVIINFIYWK